MRVQNYAHFWKQKEMKLIYGILTFTLNIPIENLKHITFYNIIRVYIIVLVIVLGGFDNIDH